MPMPRSTAASRIVQPANYQTRANPNDPTSDIITVTRDESRPLQGQSPHLASLSILYADTQYGWNMRVSGIYTDRCIESGRLKGKIVYI